MVETDSDPTVCGPGNEEDEEVRLLARRLKKRNDKKSVEDSSASLDYLRRTCRSGKPTKG
jgi:hypothetical protein